MIGDQSYFVSFTASFTKLATGGDFQTALNYKVSLEEIEKPIFQEESPPQPSFVLLCNIELR